MKRKISILGSVGVLATAGLFAVSSWELAETEGSYSQEAFILPTEKSSNDAKLWMERRYLDPETGERISEKELRQIDASIGQMAKSRSVTFIEQGPDNIGGRTRAIQVDMTNNNIVWAGGVSGGLFKSINGANTWERVNSYELMCSPFISSMCQFTNGTLFVATGSKDEDWDGNGVWYTQDQGLSWNLVPGTSSFSSGRVSEIIAPENGTTLWLTSSNGLKKWNFGDPGLTDAPTGISMCTSLASSPDGEVIVASIGSSRKTFVSTDYGVTFIDKSGLGAGVVPSNSPRIEYAVSPMKNASGNYSLYAVRTNSNLLGMNVSHDSGNTWSEFVGTSGSPSNLDIYRNQGRYNSVVTVTPQNPEKILIGGIDIWKWEQTTNTPPSGGFEKLSEWFFEPSSSKYVHADNHEMKWDSDKLYIGNDGGIGVSFDPETSFYPANRGYNVTQFYGVAFDKYGAVLGGTQDNGSLYNDHQQTTYKEFREVSGGDGFQCEISFFNPQVMFTTSQYGNALRSGDGGQTIESFVPDSLPSSYNLFGTNGSINHPFHTQIFMAEYYDENSEDSVTYIPDANHASGETILIPSLSTGNDIAHTLTAPLYFTDTLNHEPSLSATETSIVNELTGQTIYLDLYTWSHVGTSGSGLVPPLVGDSILVDSETGIDTMVVESLGSYIHYYGQHPITMDIHDMGIDPILYNVAWNDVIVQDPYQSWYLMYVNTQGASGGELWGTRNALRLSAPDQQWGLIVKGIVPGNTLSNGNPGLYNNIDVEFSRDLNHLYISTGTSQVTRVDGLGSLYSSSPTFNEDAFYHQAGTQSTETPPNATTATPLDLVGLVEGIAVNPSNPDDVLFLHGFGTPRIRRSTDATSASPSYAPISIDGNPGTYDAIIDRENDQILVVGTSHGVFVSEDDGVNWEDGSIGFYGTPVYEVRQSFRTWDEGNFRPGEIYIGTFGRGIWSSSSYLSTNDESEQASEGNQTDEFDSKLIPYPNPTSANTSLSFELANDADVIIQVFNLSGRLVQTVNKKNMNQGTQVVDLKASELSTGTYIVKMFAGEQQAVTKFVKM